MIELVVCVGVLALLIALALPVLSAAREASRRTKSSVNARTLSLAISQYNEANRELFPSIQEGVWYNFSENERVRPPFWEIDRLWICVVWNELPRTQHLDVVYSPLSPSRASSSLIYLSSYRYSWAFVARPDFWLRDAPYQPTLVTPCRIGDVRFPSQKALLWDDEAAWLRGGAQRRGPDVTQRVPVSFVDLSVASLSPADATPGVDNPGITNDDVMNLRNTEHGCAGVDYVTR